MTVITTRPNQTVSNTFDVTGPSAHAALSDDSDATMVTMPQGTGGTTRTMRLGFAEPVIPAGALIKCDRIRIRANKVGLPSPAMTLTSVRAYPDGATKAGEAKGINVNYVTPTTVAALTATPAGAAVAHTQLEAVIAAQTPDINLADMGQIVEVYWDTIVVNKPVVSNVTVAPVSPISNTDQPTISWDESADGDGGFPTRYQARVFTAAQYGAIGFDPATSPATIDTGTAVGTVTSWQVSSPLADATYRAYIRVANVVNGQLLWSDYQFVQFVISVLRPPAPTFGAVAGNNANGRIDIPTANPGGGGTSMTVAQLQRSTDGGLSYTNVRTLQGGGRINPAETARDYEPGNGQAVIYRIRGVHTFATGFESFSAWTTMGSSVSWSSTDRWVKHPTKPSLNLKAQIWTVAVTNRPMRVGEFQPLGSSKAITSADKRAPAHGELVVDAQTSGDRALLDWMLDDVVPLLVQHLPADDIPDRWVMPIEAHNRERMVDKFAADDTLETIPWVEVDEPTSDTLATWT